MSNNESIEITEEVERLLLEGLASPGGEMTAADWMEMKREFLAKRLNRSCDSERHGEQEGPDISG